MIKYGKQENGRKKMTELNREQLNKEMIKLFHKQWFQEMEPVSIKIVDKKWESYDGYYDYKKRICYVTGHQTIPNIIEAVYHEIAHHIEHQHAPDFFRKKGVMHSVNFKIILSRLHKNISLKEVIKDLYPYRHKHGWGWKDKSRTKLEWKK